MKAATSPYRGAPPSRWPAITDKLLSIHPLRTKDLISLVLGSWDDIFGSRIGPAGFRIGKEVIPQPQIMGFLLHELIPLNLHRRYRGSWRKGHAADEFDAEFIRDRRYSFEIKTSSFSNGIFGNRSYAHGTRQSSKSRSGYFLTANFEKFGAETSKPDITLIRFGWLDADDWIGQRAESGQQARLTVEAKAYKLHVIWEKTTSA